MTVEEIGAAIIAATHAGDTETVTRLTLRLVALHATAVAERDALTAQVEHTRAVARERKARSRVTSRDVTGQDGTERDVTAAPSPLSPSLPAPGPSPTPSPLIPLPASSAREREAAMQELLHGDPLDPVAAFLAVVPPQRRGAWGAAIDGWREGLGTTGGKALDPQDIAIGLREYAARHDPDDWKPRQAVRYAEDVRRRRTEVIPDAVPTDHATGRPLTYLDQVARGLIT